MTTTGVLFRERGAHVDADFDARSAICDRAVSPTSVHHLAQYRLGTFDFSADVLDRVGEGGLSGSVADRRREVGFLGRQLRFMMRTIGASLENCDSGQVIRAVFDVGSGALLYYLIRPGEYLIGLTVDAASTQAADRAMAEATTGIRALLGLPGQSPGGFERAPGSGEVLEPADRDRLHVSVGGVQTPADTVFVPLATEAVRGRELDYAARFENSVCTGAVDSFDVPDLAPHFTSISRRRRRAVHQEIGAQFLALSGSVDRALHGVLGQRVQRTVLDVEQGTLYFHRLGDSELLFGATLAQARVRVAGERFDDLVRRHAAATGRT